MNYSQNYEEQAILEYFGDYVGTFLDVGCNDCLTFSNTRALALRGWKGVFIDPSPKAMERCKTLYNGHKGYYFYEVAISDHNGKGILQESGPLCSAADVGLVSTFHVHEQERFKRTVKYEPIEVKTFRWKTFYNRLKSTKISKFDCISIDSEGEDLNILSQLDLSQTRLLVIEWNGNKELKGEFEKYLEEFKIIYTSGENIIYAR